VRSYEALNIAYVRAKADTSRALGRGVVAGGVPGKASAPLGEPPFADLEFVWRRAAWSDLIDKVVGDLEPEISDGATALGDVAD
jgi:hypothetical protein